MVFDDRDADEVLLALIQKGFTPPFSMTLRLKAEGGFEADSQNAWAANRDAARAAIEDTAAWSRYRIY